MILTFDLCLTDEVRPGTTTHFEYNAAGNRDLMTINGVTTDCSYNVLDQLVGASSPCGTARYTYSRRGNLDQITAGSPTTTYHYKKP